MKIIQSCRYALNECFTAAPLLSVTTWLCTALLGAVPALQVILVSRMTNSLIDSDRSSAIRWAVATAIAVAGFLAIQQIVYALQRMTQVAMTRQAMGKINAVSANLSPHEIASKDVQSKARAAREAIIEGGPQMQATSAISAIYSLIVVVTLFAAIARSSLLAAVMVMACMLPMAISSIWYARRDTAVWPRITEARRMATYAEEQITYQTTAMELATFDARNHVAKRANSFRLTAAEAQLGLERTSLFGDSLAGLTSSLFVGAALVSLIVSGNDSGDIAGGAAGILSGISATASVGFVIGSLNPGANAVGRYRTYVSRPCQPDTASDVSDVSSVAMESVSVRYPGRDTDAVHEVDIHATRGEIVAIVGANGAGKTTVANSLSGIQGISSGEVFINGTRVTAEGFSPRHGAFALMSQEYGRYEFTVRETLELGSGGQRTPDAALWRALRAARADTFVRNFAAGLEQQLGEQWGGVGLSGGQWQRLAIARVVLRDSPIWLLDEPISAVDAEAEEAIFDDLHGIASDKILFIISHRAWTLKMADRIYVMDGGKIVQCGTFEQLMSNGGRFLELFKSQIATPKNEAFPQARESRKYL